MMLGTSLAQAAVAAQTLTTDSGDEADGGWLGGIVFEHPERLWLLLGILIAIAVYVIVQLRQRQYAIKFTNIDLLDKVAPEGPGWYRHIPTGLFLLGMTGGLLTFAEPASVQEIPSERATVIMAIDTSLSMMADDVSPSRIDGAKEAAAEFIDELPPEINLGLVSFNGIATIRIPPTTNRAAAKAAVADLELGEATAIGEAIFASLAAIEDQLPDADGSKPAARVVLMSDGETTVGRQDEDAVEAARQAAVPISTIAFGTDRGQITLEDDPRPIPVPVNEDALEVIADGTGGQFFTAASTDELRAVYADIGSAVGFEEELAPLTAWFVGISLLLLLAAWVLSLLWRTNLP